MLQVKHLLREKLITFIGVSIHPLGGRCMAKIYQIATRFSIFYLEKITKYKMLQV